MRLCTLLLIAQLAGCTLAFPVIGGVTAASENSNARSRGKPETASGGNRVIVGLVLGVLVDALLLIVLFDKFEHTPEG
jgi:hypothetical protein